MKYKTSQILALGNELSQTLPLQGALKLCTTYQESGSATYE